MRGAWQAVFNYGKALKMNLLQTYFKVVGPVAHYLAAAVAVLAASWVQMAQVSYDVGRWILCPIAFLLVMTIPLRLFVGVDSEVDVSQTSRTN